MGIQLLTVFLALIHVILAQQGCEIGSVGDLQLFSGNDTLYWTPSQPLSANDTDCEISNYIIFVEQNDDTLFFTSYTNQFDVSQLSRCTLYNFTVAGVSGIHESKPVTIQGKTSAGQGETYDLSFTSISQDDQGIQIAWTFSDGINGCVTHFRLSYWEESSASPTDLEVDDMNYLLTDPVPCMNYWFEVRGILGGFAEGPSNITNFTAQGEVPDVLVLKALNAFPTSIDLSWNLTSTKKTRCPLVELVVDGISFEESYGESDGLNENGLFNVTVTGLEPNTAYSTQVYAKNAIGSSDPLNVILQTASNATDSEI